jgi:hypothetical protein
MGSPYSNVGPFNNNAAPAISAAFLNALETFLDSLSSAAYDSNITSDQSGNLSIPTTATYKIASFNVISSPSGQDLIINTPNAGGNHKFRVQVGGVDVFSIDSSGNVKAKGTITASTTVP